MLDPSIPLSVKPAQLPSVADISARIQQMKMQGLQQQALQQQIQSNDALEQERRQNVLKTQRAEAADKTVDELMATAFNDDGTFKRDVFEQGLAKSGQGHLYPQYAEMLDKLEQSTAKIQAEHRSVIARSIMGIEDAGNTPSAVMTALAYLKRNKLIEPDSYQAVVQGVSADPSTQHIGQMMQQLGAAVPEYRELRNAEEKRKTDLAKTQAETAKTQAEADRMKDFSDKPLTEQLLHAVSVGDAAKVNQIKQTLLLEAQAKKDPAQAALATELAGLRADEAKARIAALAEKNAPVNVEPSTYTTISGRKYVDLSEWQTPEAREKAHDAAMKAGVMPVGKEVADGLRAADTARTNFQSILSQLQDKLPKDAAGRLAVGPENKLSKYFQTDAQLAAFGSWRTAAIQAVQALAEKGMGLRLTRAEIDLMLQNDIPQITDTLGVAKQRVANMMTLLDHKEQNALERNRSAASPTASIQRPIPGIAGGIAESTDGGKTWKRIK